MSSAATGLDNPVESTPDASSPVRAIARRDAAKESLHRPVSVKAEAERMVAYETSEAQAFVSMNYGLANEIATEWDDK